MKIQKGQVAGFIIDASSELSYTEGSDEILGYNSFSKTPRGWYSS